MGQNTTCIAEERTERSLREVIAIKIFAAILEEKFSRCGS
jgi:hypothetical protein